MPVHGFTQHLVAIWLFTMAACLPPAALALSENGPAAADQEISDAEEEEAIRWVMMEGAQSMIDTLGQENGFYKDPKYRIPMPEQYRKLEKVLRRIGGAKYADAFLLSLNRTAENAVAEGGPLISSAIDHKTSFPSSTLPHNIKIILKIMFKPMNINCIKPGFT